MSERCCQFRTSSHSGIGRTSRRSVAIAITDLRSRRTIVSLVGRSGWRAVAQAPIPDTVSHGEAGIRWGFILVMVLVGVTGLWRGVGWYFDPINQNKPIPGAAVSAPAATTGPAAAAPTAAPTLPLPTDAEVALLRSNDAGNQLKGADMLTGRVVTPDVVAAVDEALQRSPNKDLEARLVCLKARFDGPEALEFALARFPNERKSLDWNLDPEVSCLLNTLVTRAIDAPDRVLDALMPAAYATNYSTRSLVLKAFRTMYLEQIPPLLLTEASTAGSPRQREALEAAMALGAIRLSPELVSRTLQNPATRSSVKQELKLEPHPNAARIVATVAAERSFESDLQQLERDKEAETHDVSAALLEIVLNTSESEAKRAAAARQLELLKEVGPIHDLRALTSTLEPSSLKSSVDAAIKALAEQQRTGMRARMRTLPS
jgi:hypothetical protein